MLFKYKNSLFSTETIAHVEDMSFANPDKPKFKVNFNSGGKAPVTLYGSIDEFLAASHEPYMPSADSSPRESFQNAHTAKPSP